MRFVGFQTFQQRIDYLYSNTSLTSYYDIKVHKFELLAQEIRHYLVDYRLLRIKESKFSSRPNSPTWILEAAEGDDLHLS